MSLLQAEIASMFRAPITSISARKPRCPACVGAACSMDAGRQWFLVEGQDARLDSSCSGFLLRLGSAVPFHHVGWYFVQSDG